MTKAASKSSLEALHNKLAETLAEMVEQIDPESKGAAAVLNVARQFLKDNGIDAVVTPESPAGRLADKVREHPFDPRETMSSH